MGYPTKIATCCYCGTRAALVLDRARHELTCAQCGAPLHNLKMLPVEKPVAEPTQPVRRKSPAFGTAAAYNCCRRKAK